MLDPKLSRYSRQVILPEFGEEGQQRLAASRVVLIGCGALGTAIANTLVRAGVGKLIVVDRDYIELNNLQRQLLFDEEDIEKGLPKAVAAAEKLRKINSSIEVVPMVTDVNPGNIERLIKECDLVLDGTDNFETRYLINDACVKYEKPWVYGGVIASHGMTMNIIPGRTPCLRCLFLESPAPGTAPTCETAGVLGPAVAVIAAIQSAEALKILIGAWERLNQGLVSIDLWSVAFHSFTANERAPDCPTCAKGEFPFLDASSATRTASLCGRDAVQLTVPEGNRLNLQDLAVRLQEIGRVTYNEFMLRLVLDAHELMVFPDGRAIIKGTSDDTVARTIYAKYIGI